MILAKSTHLYRVGEARKTSIFSIKEKLRKREILIINQRLGKKVKNYFLSIPLVHKL
jgi:hypothetical protein